MYVATLYSTDKVVVLFAGISLTQEEDEARSVVLIETYEPDRRKCVMVVAIEL